MAARSLNASTMRLALVFLAILAPSTMAATTVASSAPTVPPNLSFLGCAPFILEASLCVVGVIELPLGSHPSCCKAISELNDCAPDIYQKIPASDMGVVQKICNL